MDVPRELKYTAEHEWVSLEDRVATIGITDWAQGELGDIVFVELPRVGDEIQQAASFGTIEAVKAVSDLYAPLSGKVVEINSALDDDPMAINKEPYGEGWLIKIELTDDSELDSLLEAEGYDNLLAG